MIVIRSKIGKSKNDILVNEICKLIGQGRMWIIDMNFVPAIFSDLSCFYTQVNNLEEVYEMLARLDLLNRSGDNIKNIILNLNVPKEQVIIFKQLEIKYQVQFILTVQEHIDSDNEEVLVKVI